VIRGVLLHSQQVSPSISVLHVLSDAGAKQGDVLQAGCEMLRGLPDHDAPRDLTAITEHAQTILRRVLHAQSAVVSVLDTQSKSMSTITVPPWLAARDQYPIKLSNAAYSIVSQQPWHAVGLLYLAFPLPLS
jgi:hypothetical protein